MKVLIADDVKTNRQVLEAILHREGHVVVTAENGREAVDVFDREQPDMALMDVSMPEMDGYEATRLIKARSGARFVPVIFVTASTDDRELAHCVEVGGDDFLTKPYRRDILKAKIAALNRIRELQAVVQAQNDELRAYHEQLQREQEIARAIFTNVLRGDDFEQLGVTHRMTAASILNGDLLLARRRPSGELHLMLGDFTGHGLSAAIGAIPAAEAFYSMTARGFSIGAIAAEINGILKRILPSNLFCGATFIEVDSRERALTVWNGGLPDALLWRPAHGIVRRFPSNHLPLGVTHAFDPAMEIVALEGDERLYLYTDGLIEAGNSEGAAFGQDRLEQGLSASRDPDRVFDGILHDLAAFRADTPQHDDVALVEFVCTPDSRPIGCQAPSCPVPDTVFSSGLRREPGGSWRIGLVMDAETLHHGDHLPELMRLTTSLQDMSEGREAVFLILRELIANALDHGLLRLDSALKNTPDGFAEYYARRERALADLKEGTIAVQLDHLPRGSRKSLVIRVEDSGPGFDHRLWLREPADSDTPHGRGILLVRSLCRELTYHGAGNRAEARYEWE